MDIHSFNSTKSQENKKNPAAKCYPWWELNPGPPTFMPCMVLFELIPHLLSQTFWFLYSRALLILGIFWNHEYKCAYEHDLFALTLTSVPSTWTYECEYEHQYNHEYECVLLAFTHMFKCRYVSMEATGRCKCKNVMLIFKHICGQWRIQDFPEGVRQPQGGGGANTLFDQFFRKTAWKWKKNWLGGVCIPCASLRSVIGWSGTDMMITLMNVHILRYLGAWWCSCTLTSLCMITFSSWFT